jgi:hypothetical protein
MLERLFGGSTARLGAEMQGGFWRQKPATETQTLKEGPEGKTKNDSKSHEVRKPAKRAVRQTYQGERKAHEIELSQYNPN